MRRVLSLVDYFDERRELLEEVEADFLPQI
jgi:hypothetical protein